MRQCPFCDAEVDHVVRHVAGCPEAPEEVRAHAATTVASRDEYAKLPSPCCKLRKKILLLPTVFHERDCGIADSEILDVMTFEQVNNIDAITFNFCPWCGKPWVQMGVKVI